MIRRLAIATSCAVLVASPAFAHDPAEATYLGNEGVLVARGETKALFDAFYAESFDTYVLVPGEIARPMMQGEPPYDGIDAVFISHIHPDHFNSAMTIAYMRAHPGVRLFAGQEVYDAIRATGVAQTDPLLARIERFDLAPGDPPKTVSVGGIEVDAYAIPHSGNGRVQNLAFRVTLGEGATVMHLGDASTTESHYIPYQADFDRKTTDAAFPPYWMLMDAEGRLVLEKRIKAKQIIGVHVPAEEMARAAAARTEVGGDLFITPGEKRKIGD